MSDAPPLDQRHFHGTRVLVTGHTGFKGSWLCEWLLACRARVFGVALPPERQDSLFAALKLERRVHHTVCDIRDFDLLADAVRHARPEIVFHLAAQAFVRRSYREPLLTWQTNVTGTLNVLEALRLVGEPVKVVVVTTDKVYKNREWEFAYREEDELGGHDPYSASKAACELAVASWRSSFGSPEGVSVVTARAGNVVGPGDAGEDRLVPDCYRSWLSGSAVHVRNPDSVRPWQHVLEPLSGYLQLATARSGVTPDSCNFGPAPESHKSVMTLVRGLACRRPDERRWAIVPGDVHEARSLTLCIDRARNVLGWQPRLTFDEMMDWTDVGYTAPCQELPAVVERQLADYTSRQPV